MLNNSISNNATDNSESSNGVSNSSNSLNLKYDGNTTPSKKRTLRDPYAHRRVEKTRRDRMNLSLSKLSSLIPDSFRKQGAARVDKIKTLDIAIAYVEHLQALVKSFNIDETAPITSTSSKATLPTKISVGTNTTQQYFDESLWYMRGLFNGSIELISYLIEYTQFNLNDLDEMTHNIEFLIDIFRQFHSIYFKTHKLVDNEIDFVTNPLKYKKFPINNKKLIKKVSIALANNIPLSASFYRSICKVIYKKSKNRRRLSSSDSNSDSNSDQSDNNNENRAMNKMEYREKCYMPTWNRESYFKRSKETERSEYFAKQINPTTSTMSSSSNRIPISHRGAIHLDESTPNHSRIFVEDTEPTIPSALTYQATTSSQFSKSLSSSMNPNKYFYMNTSRTRNFPGANNNNNNNNNKNEFRESVGMSSRESMSREDEMFNVNEYMDQNVNFSSSQSNKKQQHSIMQQTDEANVQFNISNEIDSINKAKKLKSNLIQRFNDTINRIDSSSSSEANRMNTIKTDQNIQHDIIEILDDNDVVKQSEPIFTLPIKPLMASATVDQHHSGKIGKSYSIENDNKLRMSSINLNDSASLNNDNMLSIFILHSSHDFYISACLDESLVDNYILRSIIKNSDYKPKTVHKIKLDVVFSSNIMITNSITNKSYSSSPPPPHGPQPPPSSHSSQPPPPPPAPQPPNPDLNFDYNNNDNPTHRYTNLNDPNYRNHDNSPHGNSQHSRDNSLKQYSIKISNSFRFMRDEQSPTSCPFKLKLAAADTTNEKNNNFKHSFKNEAFSKSLSKLNNSNNSNKNSNNNHVTHNKNLAHDVNYDKEFDTTCSQQLI